MKVASSWEGINELVRFYRNQYMLTEQEALKAIRKDALQCLRDDGETLARHGLDSTPGDW